MDFSLTPDQKLLIKAVREFCEKYVDPIWVKMDEEKLFNIELIQKLAEMGIYGGVLSEDFGGSGATFTDIGLAMEEISSHDPSLVVSGAIGLSNSWPYILQLYGSDEAKGELLPKITSGKAFLGIASTEAQSGTDLAGIQRVRATKIDDKRWVVEGEKSIVSGGRVIERMPWGGGWFTITRTAPLETRHRGLTDFIVLYKRDGKIVEGIRYSPYTQIGRHAMDTGSLTIERVVIDDIYRVGDVDRGFYVALEGFNLGRLLIAFSLLGGVRWLLKRGLEWIKMRELFGNKLASYQSISFELARFYGELEAVRMLAFKASWLADRLYIRKDPTVKPLDVGVASAMAKVKATKLAVEAAKEVMEWFGGMAYFTELPVFRALLGALAYAQGAEGASKALIDMVARNIVEGRVTFEYEGL